MYFVSNILFQKVNEINCVIVKIIVNKTAQENRCVESLRVFIMISNSKNHPTKCWPPTNRDARTLIDRLPLIRTNVERPFRFHHPGNKHIAMFYQGS